MEKGNWMRQGMRRGTRMGIRWEEGRFVRDGNESEKQHKHLETEDRRGSWESMRMITDEIPMGGNIKTEMATSCSQAELAVERGTSTHLQNLQPKICLCPAYKNHIDKHGAEKGNGLPKIVPTWDTSHVRKTTPDIINDILLLFQTGI